MKQWTVLVGVWAAVAPWPVKAQDQSAIESAVSIQVCGSRNVVRARWMRDGGLKVRCDRTSRAEANPEVPHVTPASTNLVGLLAPALGLGAAVAAIASVSATPTSTSSTGRN